MQNSRGRQLLTLALVFGATIFGMILAGGIHLAPVSHAAPYPESTVSSGAVSVVPSASVGLPNFADLAEAVSPAVVSIQATTIQSSRGGEITNPLEFFFGPRRQPRGEQPRERRSDSSGSGFVISADGLVVTNHHVIEDATSLIVHLNGRQYPAEVIGDDPATDLALLQIEPEAPLTYLELGDSDGLRVGSWVMVIGSPLQLNNSVSVGVVSAKGRSINITPDRSLENFIQTDAAINFGNSGGPMVDLDGSVIGIATAINYGAENIGFAVPVDTLKQILPQLRENGTVRRGYLGVTISELQYEQALAFGLDEAKGVLVNQAQPGEPAEKAGIEHGDILLEVDGRKIQVSRDLIDYVSSLPPGETVELTVFRDGKTIKKKVKLGERAPVAGAIPRDDEESDDEGQIEWLGLQYQDLNDGIRNNHGIPSDQDGVWVSAVAPTSPLYGQVAPGDVLVEVNRQPVDSVEAFDASVRSVASGGFVRIYVKRFDPRSGQSNALFAFARVP